MAASHHGDTPYSGNSVTSVPVTPYTTSVDVNSPRWDYLKRRSTNRSMGPAGDICSRDPTYGPGLGTAMARLTIRLEEIREEVHALQPWCSREAVRTFFMIIKAAPAGPLAGH